MFDQPSVSEVLTLMTAVSQILDPYQTSSVRLQDYQARLLYPPIFKLLIALIVVHFILFAQACITLAVKIFLKRNGQRRKVWLWRRHYMNASQTTPYYVPNGEFAVEISQLFACLFFEIFGFAMYMAAKNPQADVAGQQFLWLTVSYAPGFFGFWYYGFSALYITLLSPGRAESIRSQKKHSILNPVAMNIVCIGTPIFIALFFLAFGIGVAVATTNERNSYRSLQKSLQELSAGWRSGDTTNIAKIEGLRSALQLFYDDSTYFLKLCRAVSFSWCAISLVVAIFYCGTTTAICMMLKDAANVAGGKIPLLGANGLQGSVQVKTETNNVLISTGKDEEKIELSVGNNFNSRVAERLRRHCYFLAWQCGILTLAVMWYFFATLTFGIKMFAAVTNQYWRMTTFWLITTSAMFISIALFLQTFMSILEERTQNNAHDSQTDMKKPTPVNDQVSFSTHDVTTP